MARRRDEEQDARNYGASVEATMLGGWSVVVESERNDAHDATGTDWRSVHDAEVLGRRSGAAGQPST